jgi:hypothetical protein
MADEGFRPRDEPSGPAETSQPRRQSRRRSETRSAQPAVQRLNHRSQRGTGNDCLMRRFSTRGLGKKLPGSAGVRSAYASAARVRSRRHTRRLGPHPAARTDSPAPCAVPSRQPPQQRNRSDRLSRVPARALMAAKPTRRR